MRTSLLLVFTLWIGTSIASVDRPLTGDQGEIPAVQLDNGKRWKANPETTQGIAAMSAILDEHAKNPMAKTVLKEKLEGEFQMIFQKCTMTGEAHNQLHNYLIPLHKMLSAMDESSGEKELVAMRDHLQAYGKYFE